MLAVFLIAEEKFSQELLDSLRLPAVLVCVAVGAVALALLLVKRKKQ